MKQPPPAPFNPKLTSLLWAGAERSAEIAGMHALLFAEAWDEPSITKLLDHPSSTALLAVNGFPKRTIGFIIGQIAADEAEVLSVGVLADCQRHGVGRQLVEGLVRAVARAGARSLHLEVAADNAAALALYRRQGFAEVGRRKGYYTRKGGGAVDALRLAKALPPA